MVIARGLKSMNPPKLCLYMCLISWSQTTWLVNSFGLKGSGGVGGKQIVTVTFLYTREVEVSQLPPVSIEA